MKAQADGVHQNSNLLPKKETDQAWSDDLTAKPQIRSTALAAETTADTSTTLDTEIILDTSITLATTYGLSTPSTFKKPTTTTEAVTLLSPKSSTPGRTSPRKLSKSRPVPPSIQATNLLIGNSKPTSQLTVLAPYWKDALDTYISKLHPRDRELVLRVEGVSFDKELLGAMFEPLRKSYQKDAFQSFLNRVNPMMSHIRSFGLVFDVAAQADANMAGLIWSGIRLALEISVRSMDLHDKVLSMFEKLSIYLPLFEAWARLFPEAEYSELSECLKETCVHFIAFIVDAIKYLRRPAIKNTLHLAFSPSLETRFKAAEDQIKFQTKHLKLQVETAGHQASEKRHRAVCNILETKMGASSGFHSSIHALRFIQNSVRNDRFFGREDVLDHLSQLLSNKLSEDGHRLSSVVVHGLGGCGKSSVAREFMYRHFDYYPVILWLHADTPEKLETQFVQIARALGFVTDSGINRSREEVLHWITNLDMEWLIVFDNADDIGILPPYWPSSSHGSVLMTSRNPLAHDEGLATNAISLRPFDIEDGGKFLHSYLDPAFVPSPEDLEAIQHLSSLFGGMPIGLRQAAAFMSTKRCNPTKFVRIYEEKKEEIEQLQLPAYTKTLANVWEMSLSTLTPDALDFLDILSLCDPDSIPTELFEKNLPETAFGSFLGDTLRQLNAIEALSNQSLINVTPRNDILSLHRIFHDATFSKLEKRNERYQKVFESLVKSLLLAIPHDYLVGRSPDEWDVAEVYSRHVNMLCSRSLHNVPPASIIPFLNLLNKLVGYFYETAQYNLGFQVVEKAKTLADKTTSTRLDPATLSHVYLNHGSLCKEINEPGQAIESLVRALALFEKAIEMQASLKESNHLANLYSELGCAYTGAERYDEAEECHKKAITLCKGGPKDVARLYANLGSCYLWKGDLQQAETVLHKALLKYDRILECNLYALGNVYLKQKRYKEALEKHQEVLEMFSKKLGHDHHVTADSCHKIGSILAIPDFESGKDLVEAEKYLRRALTTYECLWNERNFNTKASAARTMWKLSQVLNAMGGEGKVVESQMFWKQACEHLKMSRGAECPLDDEEAERIFESLVFYWSR